MSALLFSPALPGKGEFWGIEHVCDHLLFPGSISNQELQEVGMRVVIPDPWERHFHWSNRSADWNARCKHPNPNARFKISPLRARVLGKTAEDLAMGYLRSGEIDYDRAVETFRGYILSEGEGRKRFFEDDLSDFFSEGNAQFARILGRRIGFLADKIGKPIWTNDETTKVRVDLSRSGINAEERLPLRANAGGEIDMLVRVGEGSDLGFGNGLALCDIKCRTAAVSPHGRVWNPKPQAQLLCYGLLAAAGCDQFAERFCGAPDALVVINPVLGCIEAISTAKLPAHRDRLTKIGQYVCGMDTSRIERALERFSDSNW